MTVAQDRAVRTWTEPEGIALRGTLLVVPGRGESPEVYERLGRRLAADAYRVHAVTAPTESAHHARGQVEDLLASAEAGTPRVLVGSDAGAAFAAHLTATGQVPAVSALVLAGLPTSDAAAPAQGWDQELEARTQCAAHRARITADGVRRSELYAELPAAWIDVALASRIAVPVLGVHGQDDSVSPFDAARRWYAAVPRAELVAIAGGRHDALNDQTHRTVAASIVLFLERLRAGAHLPPIASVADSRLVGGTPS
ncbi:alpha/beta hydrolase [uncultured Jatrophihabitans sp.]|uniref:alpha/beta hydrolase n=1 Tax=uncultured Jatrophihabitans sp. TaxID=1610747 RepID=UPI0035CC5877